MRKKLEKFKWESRFSISKATLNDKFQVKYEANKFVVDLKSKTCICRGWQLIGMPCIHAISAIHYMRQNVDDYVDEYFKRGMYLNSYYLAIEPINGRSMWPEVSGDPIHPPPFKKMPGRPKISRKKSIDEIRTDPKDPTKLSRHGIRMKCTICNEYGHNKRGCHKKDNPPQ